MGRLMARAGVRIERNRFTARSGVDDRSAEDLAHGPADRQRGEQNERDEADAPAQRGTHGLSITVVSPHRADPPLTASPA
jgi:hypothetical protein